jgi:peptide/nickel transport system substrate-binding protein
MRRYAARAAYLFVATALVSGACTGSPLAPSPTGSDGSGGTLRLLYDQTITTWDPQRMYSGPEGAIAVRLFTRTLTGYPAGGAGGVSALTGDLATDTGTPSDGAKTWTFTLRSGPTWEDGKPVTCQDVAFGIARSFAREQLPGGAPYPMTLLDIPSRVDSAGHEVSGYPGPYAVSAPTPTATATATTDPAAAPTATATATTDPTAAAAPTSTATAAAQPDSGSGSAEFDSAVSCRGATLTIRLKVPVPEFPEIVALPAFAAYRQDHDRGGAGTFDVFSCGPYRLDGGWEAGAGGRFVRNTSWDRSSDPLRRALPDVVDIREAIPVATLVQRLVEDKAPDHTAIGISDLPAATHAALLADPALRARVSNPLSGTVELLQPNVKSPVMSNEAVRKALALSTSRDAFAAAYGTTVMTPADSALAASIPGHVDASRTTASPGVAPSDSATAAAMRADPAGAGSPPTAAGVTLPVHIRVAYRRSAPADAAYAALKAGWESAGFEVTLEGLGEDYYRIVSAVDASANYDVFRRSWFADYPAGSAVIPELFDGRMNLTASGTGQDLGSFNDETINAAIDAAQVEADATKRAQAWAAIDAKISQLGGQIPLAERRRFFLRGSAVSGYSENPYLGGWVDLAAVSVTR